MAHAGNFQRFLVVEGFYFAAENRRALDGRVHHSVHLGIHSIDRFSDNHIREVVTRGSFADVAPGALGLEFQFRHFGHGQLRGGGGQFAVTQAASRGRVNDGVQIGFAFRRRDSPLVGGGLREHHARGRAGLAHGLEEFADGMRAVRILRAVAFVAEGLFEFHALPVGIQFIGQNQRHGSAAGRAHFRAMGDDVDCSVGIDSHEYVGVQRGMVDLGVPRQSLRVQRIGKILHAQHKRARRCRALQKPAPAYVLVSRSCQLLRRGFDRGTHALVGSAAADISGHRGVNIRVGRFLCRFQEGSRRHHLPGLAIPALRHVDFHPGFLHRMQSIRAQPFDRGDFRAGDRSTSALCRSAPPCHPCVPCRRRTAPSPQPNFVPVSRSSSRRYHSSGIVGSPSKERSVPFTFSLTIGRPRFAGYLKIGKNLQIALNHYASIRFGAQGARRRVRRASLGTPISRLAILNSPIGRLAFPGFKHIFSPRTWELIFRTFPN